jgi:predicted PurR-regulated permease PerM
MLGDAVQCVALTTILPEMPAHRSPPDSPDRGTEPAPAPAAAHHPIAPRQYLWLAGAAAVLAAALHWLGPVLTPFLIGAILAYLGNPIAVRCERAGLPRTLGTLVAVFVMSAAALALLLVIVPLVQAELTMLLRRLPDLAALFTTHVAPRLTEYLGISVQFDLATLRELASENIESVRELGARLLSGVRSGGMVLLSLIVNLALVPVVMFYLLRDWNLLVGRIDELVPRRWLPLVRGIATDIDNVLAEFLRGQSLVMLSLAAYYVVALSVVGLKFALPIGVLTGLLVFIPYVGFGLGFVLGVLAALLQWSGWPGFVAVLAVYGVGQLVENYLLIPYLVGDRIGLHPLAVIFALLAFGQLFGFAGVLLALPVSAAMLVGLRRLREAYVASPIYRET